MFNPLSIPSIWLARPFLLSQSSLPPGLILAEGDVISAQVLRSHGSRALLDIAGRSVLAETRLPLRPGAELQLVVKGVQNGQLVLHATGRSAGAHPIADSDILQLLQRLGLADDDLNLAIVKALMQSGMELAEPNISAVRMGLLRSQAGAAQIEQAVYLRQSNVPITTTTLALLSGGSTGHLPFASWSQLAGLMQTAIAAQEHYRDRAGLSSLLRQLQDVLETADIRQGLDSSHLLAGRLHRALEAAGSPVEARLAMMLGGNQDEEIGSSLRLILQFIAREAVRLRPGRGVTTQRALDDVIRVAESLSKHLELQQLINAAEHSGAETRKSYLFTMPLVFENEPQDALVKVERDGGGETGTGSPYPVRLLLDLDMSRLGPLEVDLRAWPGRKLECSFRPASDAAAGFLSRKSAVLAEGLRKVGFDLQRLECTSGGRTAAPQARQTLPVLRGQGAAKIDVKA